MIRYMYLEFHILKVLTRWIIMKLEGNYAEGMYESGNTIRIEIEK